MRRAGLRWGALPLPLALVSAFLLPARAEAHMAVKGMGHFMGGVLHPLTAPAHILILLALGLALGQHLPLRLGLTVRVFAPFSALGLALTTTGWIPGVPPVVLAAISLVAGGLVAFGKQLPRMGIGALLAGGALAMGLDSRADNGSAGAVVQTLLGTWLGLFVLLLNVVYYASLAAEKDRQWLHIGLRVAGSWIAAISVLMLAFALRK